MLLTARCLAVVLLSPLVVGVPLQWLVGRRRPLTEFAWLQAPFLGLATVILVLQNLVYLGVPLRVSTPLFWGAVLLLWLWFWRSGQLRASFAQFPSWVFAVVLAVYLVHGVGLLRVGAGAYVGRAWSDMFGYTTVSQFLVDERFSTTLPEVTNSPYLAAAVFYKADRIGQSVLLGFFTASSCSTAKTLFEPTILLSAALLVLAVHALCRRLGFRRWHAGLTALAAGLLPALTQVHLESFFSQALALPLLLFCPVLFDDLREQPDRYRFGAVALVVAATVSIYTEFWLILVGLLVLFLVFGLAGHSRRWRPLAYFVVLTAAPFLLNPQFAPFILCVVQRLTLPVLTDTYPWAYHLEGLARVWLGDLAAVPTGLGQSVVRLYALAATTMAYYGLIRLGLERLLPGNPAPTPEAAGPSRPLALSLLGLALLPVLLVAKDDQHPYQFYKLLLSISPLLVAGLSLAFQERGEGNVTGSERARFARGLALLPTVGVLVVVLAAGGAGTLHMVLETTSDHIAERYAGFLHLAPDVRAVSQQLERLRGNRLLLVSLDHAHEGWPRLPHLSYDVRRWFSYHARRNQVWLANPQAVDEGVPIQFQPRFNLGELPDDLLVLDSKAPGVRNLLPRNLALVWDNGFYRLWRATAKNWAVLLGVDNPNGLETAGGSPFLWLGQGTTTLEVLAVCPGTVYLTANIQPGPSLPTDASWKLRLTSSTGGKDVERELSAHAGPNALAIPVAPGRSVIKLEALDAPVPGPLANGDNRPLLFGVANLSLEFAPATASAN
jgi:hypothetical protein